MIVALALLGMAHADHHEHDHSHQANLDGDATGEVLLSSGLGTESYDLNGTIDDSHIEFDWYVEALRFDGSFTTD